MAGSQMNLRETGRNIEAYSSSIDMSTTKFSEFSESARKSSQRAGRGLKPATTCLRIIPSRSGGHGRARHEVKKDVDRALCIS